MGYPVFNYITNDEIVPDENDQSDIDTDEDEDSNRLRKFQKSGAKKRKKFKIKQEPFKAEKCKAFSEKLLVSI